MTQVKHLDTVSSVIKDLEKILVKKGEMYGNTLLERPKTNITTHIQDKIDRIVDGNACMKETVQDDDLLDLAGYCVLYMTWLSLHDKEAYKMLIEHAISCK